MGNTRSSTGAIQLGKMGQTGAPSFPPKEEQHSVVTVARLIEEYGSRLLDRPSNFIISSLT
jgi:hypothetical protein